MASGMWLTFIEIIIIAIAGVILFIVVIVFSMSTGALNFGFNCYFAFVEYNLVNSYLEPFTSFISGVGFNSLSPSSISATQIQAACITENNINAYSTQDLGTQIYGKAASCFDLFAGNNQQVGNTLLNKGNFNNIFNCYYGKVYNYESGGISTFADVINYIDRNYYNPNNPLQIVLITNGTGGLSNYTGLNAKVENGSYYDIAYFRYTASPCPTIAWTTACDHDRKFAQPNITNAAACNYLNNTVSASGFPVSSLTSGASIQVSACVLQNYTIPFCGVLLNTMVNAQNRVFVCISNP